MLPDSDKARLEFIQGMIADIRTITTRHGGIQEAMSDMEGHHAVMMCMLQIGEAMGKLGSPVLKEKLPVELAYRMRNIIAHDYLGISSEVIISTIQNDLPALENVIKSYV